MPFRAAADLAPLDIGCSGRPTTCADLMGRRAPNSWAIHLLDKSRSGA
jgi:hypothetical protein